MDRLLSFLIYIITAFSRFSKLFARIGLGSYDEWAPGKKRKILLAGYNGARNTGSDVRVVAIARQLKMLYGADQVQITVMTLSKDALKGYFDEDVTLLEFSSIFPLDLYRACCSHHAVILCEGSTLKSTFANALTLFLCEAAGIMGAQGKPCIAYGSEAGRMDPFLRRAALRLCRKTTFITRTQDSLTALRALGLNGYAGTDTAWLYDRAIDRADAEKLLYEQGWDGKKPLLGVAVINPFCWPVRASLFKWLKGKCTGNLSGQYDKWYFFSDSPARRRAYSRYIRNLAAAVNSFHKKSDCFPVLIGMERLDESACRSLRAKLHCDSAIFLSGYCSANIITGVLRRLSILLTSRYHAAVLSMGAEEGGCPIVAVSMDERLGGILHELSLDQKYLLSTSDPALGKKAYRAMKNAAAHSREIRRHIRRAVTNYKAEQEKMGAILKEALG